MIGITLRNTLCITLLLAFISPGPSRSQDATARPTIAAKSSDPLATVAAECGTTLEDVATLEACANRKLFKSTAKTYARIQRLVLIGKLCHRLSEDDAQAILANSRSELEDARSVLTDQDKEWAKTWQEGVVIGATQAADVRESVSDEACDRFAQPGGALTKIMSWSGKPQSVDGILVSPRSTP